MRGAETVAEAGGSEPRQHDADERTDDEHPPGAVTHSASDDLDELVAGEGDHREDETVVAGLGDVTPERQQEERGEEAGEHCRTPTAHVHLADGDTAVGVAGVVVRQPQGSEWGRVAVRGHRDVVDTVPTELEHRIRRGDVAPR